MNIKKQGLEIINDKEKGIIILEPHSALSENDFKEASIKIDGYLKEKGKLNGVIIYTKDFPYWNSFSGFISHLKFVKNYQNKIPYLAFVIDSIAGTLADKIGDYFVSAKIKHFTYNELAKAKKWIISDEDGIINHKFYINKDYLDTKGFLEIKIIGKLTHEDYKKAIPILDSIFKKLDNKNMNILVDMSEFDGWELKAAWDDFKFGMKHDFKFGKIAIIGNDEKWIDYSIKISSWFIKGEVEQFETKRAAIKFLEN